MEQIDYDIDDFMTYCEVKNLSKKTMQIWFPLERCIMNHLAFTRAR